MGETIIDYRPLARTAVRKSLAVKKGENVIVETWNHGLPIAREIIFALRDVGANSLLLLEDEETYWRSVEGLAPNKLGNVGSHEWAAMKEADCYVFLPGPADIARVRKAGRKYRAATSYNTTWYRNAEKWGIRGVRLSLGYATPERAAAYGLDADAWRRMLLDASALDPKVLQGPGKKIQRALRGKGRVEVTAPNGTDFTFDLPDRSVWLTDGVTDAEDVKEGNNMSNLPGGTVSSTVDETSGDGVFIADRPGAYLGKWMKGISFEFKDGRLKEYHVREGGERVGEDFREEKNATKQRLSSFIVGLNPAIRYGFLQDTLAAGAFHLGFGDNEEDGGKNKGDFYLGGTLSNATVAVDGKEILRGGKVL